MFKWILKLVVLVLCPMVARGKSKSCIENERWCLWARHDVYSNRDGLTCIYLDKGIYVTNDFLVTYAGSF